MSPDPRHPQEQIGPIPTDHLMLLGAFRVALTVFSGRNDKRIVTFAPYSPSNRPTDYKVKIKAPPHFIFSMNTGNKSNPRLHISTQLHNTLLPGGHGKRPRLRFGAARVVIVDDNGKAFQSLAHEISLVGRGVSLNTKSLADKRSDNLVREPLWSHIPFGQNVARARQALARANDETGGAFGFWITWYEHLLTGTLPDVGLLKRLANIDDSVWSLGPEAVAAEIKRIEAELQIQTSPLAETVEINPETRLFRVVPIPIQNELLIGALMTRVSDALEDAVQGMNGLNDRSREVRVLGRTIARYGNDPQRVEMDFTSVAKGLRRQIHDTAELPDSEDNLALLEALEDGVRGLRATHPEVAANRDLLTGQALRELGAEDRALLEQAEPVLIAISEDIMTEDFAADIPELVNDALSPLPEGAPRLPAVDPATRVFNRTAKLALLWDKALNTVSAAHDSRTHKVARLGMTVESVGALLFDLVRLGLKLFGVL